jgi:hypothetical protein
MAKRNNSAPGCGIDGAKGERFTEGGTSPWDSNPRGDFVGKGRGVYQDAGVGLRNVPQNGGTSDMSDGRDIWEAVEGQSSDSGNRAVRSGRKD